MLPMFSFVFIFMVVYNAFFKPKKLKTTKTHFSKIRTTKRYFHHDKNISMGVNYRSLFFL